MDGSALLGRDLATGSTPAPISPCAPRVTRAPPPRARFWPDKSVAEFFAGIGLMPLASNAKVARALRQRY
jgi:hypothetical protein